MLSHQVNEQDYTHFKTILGYEFDADGSTYNWDFHIALLRASLLQDLDATGKLKSTFFEYIKSENVDIDEALKKFDNDSELISEVDNSPELGREEVKNRKVDFVLRNLETVVCSYIFIWANKPLTQHIENELTKKSYDALIILSGSIRQLGYLDWQGLLENGVGPYFKDLTNYCFYLKEKFKEKFPKLQVIFEPITKPDVETKGLQPGDNYQLTMKVWDHFEAVIKEINDPQKNVQLLQDLYDTVFDGKPQNSLFDPIQADLQQLKQMIHHYDDTKFSLAYMIASFLSEKYKGAAITLCHTDDVKEIYETLAKTMGKYRYLFPNVAFHVYNYTGSSLTEIPLAPCVSSRYYDVGSLVAKPEDVRVMFELYRKYLKISEDDVYDYAVLFEGLGLKKFEKTICANHKKTESGADNTLETKDPNLPLDLLPASASEAEEFSTVELVELVELVEPEVESEIVASSILYGNVNTLFFSLVKGNGLNKQYEDDEMGLSFTP